MRFAVAVLGVWIIAVVGYPLWPVEPNVVHLDLMLEGPRAGAWLGYDEVGRAVWDRLLAGAVVSLQVALIAVTGSMLIGIPVGLLSGYRGGAIDHLVVRIIDVVLAFPGLLLAIALAGMLGPGVGNVVIALVAVGWVGFARLTRAQVLSLRERDHVLAARALGTGTGWILLRHLLPLCAAPLIVEATFGIAVAVLSEAGLSYLGLGVQPPTASWGSMIRDGSRYLLVAPHYVLAPGIALGLVVLAVNLAGDALRDRLDVTLRGG